MTEGQIFLQKVLQKLKERILEVNASLEEGEKEIESMHEYYWENYAEMDEYGYENFDNQQALLNQINTNDQQLKYRQRLRRMQDSPFFARVDFCFDGDDLPETFYIGIGNFAEKAGKTPLIFDWRAPVSGLFYDYDKGPAAYEAPGGTMEGNITAKWQYKIRRGKMQYEFESDIKIDDEILKAELGANSDVQLKNIIRTIQKEQNAIIRNTKDRILVVQGVAGSGKTSVALHRIAYLLYHDRKNLKSSNVLILSPNGIFADYISHILPELGEENIQEMSLDLFAYRELRDTVSDCEDKYDRIERLLRKEKDFFWEKQSDAFLNQMEGYVLELEDELMQFHDVSYRNYEIPSSRIVSLFYEKFLDMPLLARMSAVREYLVDEYETIRGKDLNEEEIPLFEEMFESMYETKDIYTIYREFLVREGYRAPADVPYEKRILAYEDVYPLLYLKYRLYGTGQRRNIRHLIIDEMQDYTKLQYRILERLFTCRMTILGDRAQTMDERPLDVLRFLPKIFGKDIRCIEMRKSYRNTVEIAQYAAELAGTEAPELFERHGKPVEKAELADWNELAEAVEAKLSLGENAYETAAVLTLTAGEAQRVSGLLKERFDQNMENVEVHYVDRDSSAFKRGITVAPFYLAKGLEFDQVFAVTDSRQEGPLIRQAGYICATRALHELYMYTLASFDSDSI